MHTYLSTCTRAHNEEECVTSGTCVPGGMVGELVPKFRMKPLVPNCQ